MCNATSGEPREGTVTQAKGVCRREMRGGMGGDREGREKGEEVGWREDERREEGRVWNGREG